LCFAFKGKAPGEKGEGIELPLLPLLVGACLSGWLAGWLKILEFALSVSEKPLNFHFLCCEMVHFLLHCLAKECAQAPRDDSSNSDRTF
jgi:hypothetical protein